LLIPGASFSLGASFSIVVRDASFFHFFQKKCSNKWDKRFKIV